MDSNSHRSKHNYAERQQTIYRRSEESGDSVATTAGPRDIRR